MSTLDPAAWRLQRYPATSDRSLRAFDAADQLALAAIADQAGAQTKVLAVNDGFGGLAVPLVAAGADVTVWTDSALSATAIERNLAANDLGGCAITASTERLAAPVDIVVLKVPKTLAFLHEQLVGLRRCLDPSTRIIGAGMVKHVHTSTLELFERSIGPTVTSLAKKKARLILPTLDEGLEAIGPGWTRYTTDQGVECVNHPNVFSHGKLDIGTRFFLEQRPPVPDGAHIVDLGCGNGVLGTTLASSFHGGSVTFCDVSHAAIVSAQATWQANTDGDERATFHSVDLAAPLADATVDLVVINPPFHDQHVVGDETARRMFTEARRILRQGGEVRVVGNRHLGYHKRLRQLFGNLETVASNPKFVVLSSRKSSR